MVVTLTQTLFAELALRGAASALLIYMGVRFLRSRGDSTLSRLGGTFAFGTAAYSILSVSVNDVIEPPLLSVLELIGTLNSVFFWWFATALFDDEFRWNTTRLLPAAVMLVIYTLRTSGSIWVQTEYDELVQQCLIALMMGHALILALLNYQSDLIEPRRRFRLAFATFVGITGLLITLVEFVYWGQDAVPPSLSLLHAFSMFALSFGFCYFLMDGEQDVFDVQPTMPSKASELPEFPDQLAQRLDEVMREGAFRGEGLTIAMLAETIGMPEYRLRRLINQQLGHKNFNSYLNGYRIAEAERILSDSAQIRRQVTLIAFDLGYGSVSTFNRAFKQATGFTPSAYRKAALAGLVPVGSGP
ncbi:MAG: AraC family transcriptional regulator [Pseudomonadota bacterium]